MSTRLSEDLIKQGILHPEQLVRDAAARYFADSFSDDPTIMPLAIKAVETHGWEDAFDVFREFADLAQTDQTLLWSIAEMKRKYRHQDLAAPDRRSLLSAVISGADVDLLVRHESAIMAIDGLAAEHREAVAERLQLLAADTDACWADLERFCEEAKDKHYSSQVGLAHARRLVEAIGRGDADADRVHSILSQEIEEYGDDDPMGWMDPLAAHLVGEVRLESAVPLLIAKLHQDLSDLLDGECTRAFIKIGTDATAEKICEPFPAAPWHYRLYITGALANIHSDAVVSRCLDLYGPEKDPDVKVGLIRALLMGFSRDGVAPARETTLRGMFELRRQLVAVATLMGVWFPELDQWMEQEREEAKTRQRRREEMVPTPYRPKPQPKPKAKTRPTTPASKASVQAEPQAPITRGERVGRNSPCPCGSGKKYKKCCMNKGR